MLEGKVFRMTTEFNYLKEWILNFLSTPQESLNGFSPCPYAKKSLIDNRIKFYKTDDYFVDICNLFDNWDDAIDVVIYLVPDDVDKNKFVNDVKTINNIYLKQGFACLEDHKDIPENFCDLKFNNGKYNIILCQKTDKINHASAILFEKGYYKNWSQELYNDVVAWRSGPSIS